MTLKHSTRHLIRGNKLLAPRDKLTRDSVARSLRHSRKVGRGKMVKTVRKDLGRSC